MLRPAAWACVLLAATIGHAAEKPYVFALVPKATNNPFFDQAYAGCKKAEQELQGRIKCLYVGPSEEAGGDEQAQTLADLIARKVDGIAVSPTNAAVIAAVLARAKAVNIPVITFDSDLFDKDKGLRATYIGTHNYDLGVNIAKLVMGIKSNGGTICIQSGGSASVNHNERMQGIRDTLAGARSPAPPGERLTGRNGWTEVAGCALYSNDDFAVANQQMEDALSKYPVLDAFTPTGGLPQILPDAYTKIAERVKDKITSGRLALVVGDTLPVQIELLKKGLSSGQVGQRPFDMGLKAMYALLDMKEGKPPPPDPTYTGLDICTPENVDHCVNGG